MNIGRNAPCPCGSGKKYKKCCLQKQQAVSSVEAHYRRLSKAHDKLANRLMKQGRDAFGDEAILAAVDEFWGWPESEDDLVPTAERLDRAGPLFWPWFVFSWYYDPDDFEEPLDCPANLTVAEYYARQRGPAIDSLEAKIISAFGRKPYSFYEVLSVDLGRSMVLKDVLTGWKITVQECAGSEYLQPTDMVFGRAAMVDGVGMIVGLGTTIIPPGFKPQLIDVRNRLREGRRPVTDEQLYDWDMDIRQFYLAMEEHLHQPPQLTNTDGDFLEFHKLVYQIESSEEAFCKMASLCATETPQTLRQAATLDAKGQIISVEFPWSGKGFKGHSGLDNTIFGHIRIDKEKMTIDVNSAGRAERIRQEVERRLGTTARFRLDEIQDMDAMMERSMDRDGKPPSLAESDELMKNPEVMAQLQEMMERHWIGWVDEKLPALNGKTPRKAVRTADGREAVEALLTDIERKPDDDGSWVEMNRRGVRQVREILGLSKKE